jgi:hypothetical protein
MVSILYEDVALRAFGHSLNALSLIRTFLANFDGRIL